MRTESENLIVSAKRADKETLLELFRIESIKMQLPIGCGLATICGEHSDYNNVCVLFRYSDESRDFDSLLKYKGEMSDFAGAVILSKKNGHTINEILELAG